MDDEKLNQDLNSDLWAVIGASGFVGSGISEEILKQGIQAKFLQAPRLSMNPDFNSDELEKSVKSSEHLDPLIRELRGVSVLINAAGLALPGSRRSPELFGANAALPLLILKAAEKAKVKRVIFLSSAAVQGNKEVLDESSETTPFSPYSESKALGEFAVLRESRIQSTVEVIIIRATSVQGAFRPTTDALKKIAKSPLASVSSPGSQPTVVSSLSGLSSFVVTISKCRRLETPAIFIQPWEGASVADVLRIAGDKPPRIIPSWICKTVIFFGKFATKIAPSLSGSLRRLEVMWFGQSQVKGLALEKGYYVVPGSGDGPTDTLRAAFTYSGTL